MTATLSSKFCASVILFSNQYVTVFENRIILSALGDVFSFSDFVQALPTNSEGRTALKTIEKKTTFQKHFQLTLKTIESFTLSLKRDSL